MKGLIARYSNERGAALVIALIVITVLVVISAALVTTSTINTRISGIDQRRAKALDLAEAGIGEAVGRIKAGEVPSNLNPRMVTQIFNANGGSVPALGVDSTGLATAQPAGNWLNYSTATRDPYTLTVRYKTDASRTTIYKYDPVKSIPIQSVSGMPIYQVQSTGRVGNAVRTVLAELVAVPVNVNVRGALVSAKNVTWSGNDFYCGYDHRADTPVGKGNNGRAGAGGCNENAGLNQWEVGASGDNHSGIWSSGTITNWAGYVSGTPTPTAPSQPSPFYAGPWESLGMTAAQFWTWVGASTNTAPGVPKGIIYLDNDGTAQNQSGAFTFNGGDGDGFLYVDGDLNLNGNFHYKGLIYVEGDLRITSWAWILGGVVVRGKTTHNNTSNGTVLYSKDAITQNIQRYGSYTTIAWREVSL